MTVTKEHLTNSIYEQCGCSKNKSIQLVESIFEIMKKTLENGEEVMISRFGTFCVKDKSERRGRNPATGGDMMLGAKRIVIFRCSGVLREKINK